MEERYRFQQQMIDSTMTVKMDELDQWVDNGILFELTFGRRGKPSLKEVIILRYNEWSTIKTMVLRTAPNNERTFKTVESNDGEETGTAILTDKNDGEMSVLVYPEFVEHFLQNPPPSLPRGFDRIEQFPDSNFRLPKRGGKRKSRRRRTHRRRRTRRMRM